MLYSLWNSKWFFVIAWSVNCYCFDTVRKLFFYIFGYFALWLEQFFMHSLTYQYIIYNIYFLWNSLLMHWVWTAFIFILFETCMMFFIFLDILLYHLVVSRYAVTNSSYCLWYFIFVKLIIDSYYFCSILWTVFIEYFTID